MCPDNRHPESSWENKGGWWSIEVCDVGDWYHFRPVSIFCSQSQWHSSAACSCAGSNNWATHNQLSLNHFRASCSLLYLDPALLWLSQALQRLLRSAWLWLPFGPVSWGSSWNDSALTSSPDNFYPLGVLPVTQENMEWSRKLNIGSFSVFFFSQNLWTFVTSVKT